jgi:hypothetical protein
MKTWSPHGSSTLAGSLALLHGGRHATSPDPNAYRSAGTVGVTPGARVLDVAGSFVVAVAASS